MAFVNPKNREVQVKVVYYGPGRGGKTTNLEYIYRKFNSRIKTEMVTIKTHGDRTLFFDFLPFDIGKINGYDVKIQLYTVPGQVKYNATRRLVLRGVDGIVFVADAMAVRREKNILALKNLQENLKPGSSAIIALVEHEWVGEIVEALDQFGGESFRQALPDEIVAQLLSDADQ